MSIAEIPAIPRLGLGSAGVSMTPEEYDAVQSFDDDYCYELIHGVLVVTPFASEAERSPNELLGHWLWEYGRVERTGMSSDRDEPLPLWKSTSSLFSDTSTCVRDLWFPVHCGCRCCSGLVFRVRTVQHGVSS